ncbi:acyltransferase family protein [Edaphobacter modestus]|uniref:Peptidoglycan/LPS O-acetylase OafA/YrhL n=1 Tax=Edaphobacter modestus TaxID=388466 RepID=A0A4Q7YVK5_9BACT|nr:acyltransferase [Edaphobacter modestus]RZU41181.1 peptidoglycan/LPS O-acetylase OafA/YrhL [Edaphobacter modestus]
MSSSTRVPQLDGLRGLAILLVLVHHAYHVKLLWMGVDVFFVLSGFLITSILLKEKAKPLGKYIGNFYAHRVRRILPAYLMALLIVGVVVRNGWTHFWPYYIGAMNFMQPLGIHQSDVLPLWSLAVEEQFYLIWPLVVFWMGRKHLTWLASGLLVLAPILRFLCTPLFKAHWAIYMLLPFRMDTLAAGALIAILGTQVPRKLYAWAVAVGIGGLMALSYFHVTTYANTRPGNTLVYECTLLIAFGLFAYALGASSKVLAWAPLRYVGTISYSIYLMHLLALSLIPSRPLAIIAVLSYSTLSWFYYEKPILRYRREVFALQSASV